MRLSYIIRYIFCNNVGIFYFNCQLPDSARHYNWRDCKAHYHDDAYMDCSGLAVQRDYWWVPLCQKDYIGKL